MLQLPFHAYAAARLLECESADDGLTGVFASSDIRIYPFQIAAASFALRSPYQKGVILCDEAGMGKSHEAMLVMNQRFIEGQTRILLCIPNGDLLTQWTRLLERSYSIPYTVLTDSKQWAENTDAEHVNAFEQVGIVLTTYGFAAEHEREASRVSWDLAAFEEANGLSGVYHEENKQARALYRIAGKVFKLLLTGTPIEKNIMDLYGMIWFIDPTVLEDERAFLARYLRKPENYPELAARISRHCFRTLRSQAKGYAKIPDRVLMTIEYTPTDEERRLYDLLYAYINRPDKLAFPEMDTYDLALRLLGLQSSSTASISQTVSGILSRLQDVPEAGEEIAQLQEIASACALVKRDAKAELLMDVLQKGFSLMKKAGARRKAVVFTQSVETLRMLRPIVRERYQTAVYDGAADYSAIQAFKRDAEVLLSTDNGAKGFNLEEASFVIHYDLLYNSQKMEQRIDRCHRLGQENDVLSVAFIDKHNFSDVRKLELVSKRMLVSDGVFGVSDEVLGGFTGDLAGAFRTLARRTRTKAQVEEDYQRTLRERETVNRDIVASAEEIFFTTFTQELADKVKLSPRYIDERAARINETLWELAKWFFTRYNEEHDDCRFVIDEYEKTISATAYEKLPVLFYYWDGSRNKRYQSQKKYGMGMGFTPRHGRVTLSSIIGRGILHELECADEGRLIVRGAQEPCEIGLYHVSLAAGKRRVADKAILVGRTASGEALSRERCREILSLPVLAAEQVGRPVPHWLKNSCYDELDDLLNVQALLEEQKNFLLPARQEEIERYRLDVKAKKAALSREIDDLSEQIRALEAQRDAMTSDRLGKLAMNKRINQLRQSFMKKQENQFLDAMRLDLELEQRIQAFMEEEKLTATVDREFKVRVEYAKE